MSPALEKGLAAYLPMPLIGLWRAAGDPRADVVLDAVVLIADIVDSTGLTDRYGAFGLKGAEDLGGVLDAYFAEMTTIVEHHGGMVARIAGDAVFAIWRSGENQHAAARAALAAGREMHVALILEELGLAHRLTIDSGPIRLSVLGEDAERRFFLVSGRPLRAMADQSLRGGPGELRVSPWTIEQANATNVSTETAPLTFGEPVEAGDFAELIPPLVRRRIDLGLADWMAEFRTLSVVYVGLPQALSGDEIRRAFLAIESAAAQAEVGIWDVVEEDKGLVVKVILGLPPYARERDAVAALDVACRARRSLADIGMSAGIGVATGPAFCGEVGGSTRREHIAVGQVMNYGARLMQAADGGILCDEATSQAARDSFDTTEVFTVQVRGRAEPLSARRVAYLAEAARPDGGTDVGAPIGRTEAVNALEATLSGAAQGKDSAIIVQGEAGVGKTVLLRHAVHRAESLGLKVIGARASLTERSTAFHMLRRLLASFVGAPRAPADRETTLAAMRSTLREEGHSARLFLLDDVFPPTERESGSTGLTGAARRTLLEDLIVRFLNARRGTTPLVVIIDDLQWVDVASREVLGGVRQRLRRILFLMATRESDAAGSASDRLTKEHRVIPLNRLPLTDTATIARAELGVERIPPRLADYLQERSGGLPLHARQLLLSLVERGSVSVRNGRCVVEPGALAGDSAPATLRGLVIERIDRLTPFDQITAKSASVIGPHFSLELLRSIHPVHPDAARLRGAIARLENAGFVERRGSGRWAFPHAILRETLYEMTPFGQKSALHVNLARRMEVANWTDGDATSAELAWHWEAGGVPSKAVDRLIDAGRGALRAHAVPDALDHAANIERIAVEAVLDLQPRQRVELERLRADGLQELGRINEAEHHFRRCAKFAGLTLPRSRPALIAGLAIETFRHGVARLGIASPRAGGAKLDRDQLAAHICMRLAEHDYFASDTLGVMYGTLKSLNHAKRCLSTVEMTQGYAGLAVGLGVAGLASAARTYAEQALRLAKAYGDVHALGLAHMMATVAKFPSGAWDEAGDHARLGATHFEVAGDSFRRQSCTVLLAYVQAARGNWSEARGTLERTPDATGDIEVASVRAWAAACNGMLDCVQNTRPDAALEALRACLADPLGPADRLVCLGPMAILQLATGDRDGAIKSAKEALTVSRAKAPKLGITFVSLPRIVETFLAVEDIDRARQALSAARAFAGTVRIARPHTDYAAGQLASALGRTARARRYWRRGQVSAEAMGMVFEAAICRDALNGRGNALLR